jgi:S1-C subfamily serine protease
MYFPGLLVLMLILMNAQTAETRQQLTNEQKESHFRIMWARLGKEEQSDVLKTLSSAIRKRESLLSKETPEVQGTVAEASETQFVHMDLDRLKEMREITESLITNGIGSISPDKLGGAEGEAIINIIRAAYLFCKDDVLDKNRILYWRHDLENFTRTFKGKSRSVGLIEFSQNQEEWKPIGTGFIAAPGIIATNKHVAEQFAKWDEQGRGEIREAFSIRINFTKEAPSCHSVDDIVPISSKPILVHQHYDVALFTIDNSLSREVLPIATEETYAEGEVVAIIGYPARDSRSPRNEQENIFLSEDGRPPALFLVKRLQPGEIMRLDQDDPSEFDHDASTLGGNSGSPVVRLSDGAVIGLHRTGYLHEYNVAVKGSKIMELIRAINGLP